jgi:hypothetical protein
MSPQKKNRDKTERKRGKTMGDKKPNKKKGKKTLSQKGEKGQEKNLTKRQ